MREYTRINSSPVILYRDRHIVPLIDSKYGYSAGCFTVADSIVHQVEKHLFNQGCIHWYEQGIVGHRYIHSDIRTALFKG